jgi:hypothetical protein
MKDEIKISSPVDTELKPLSPVTSASFPVAKTASMRSLALATVAGMALPLTAVQNANAKAPEQVIRPEFERVYQSQATCLDSPPDPGDPADWSKHDNFDMSPDTVIADPGAPGFDSIDSIDSSGDPGGSDGSDGSGGGDPGGDYGW